MPRRKSATIATPKNPGVYRLTQLGIKGKFLTSHKHGQKNPAFSLDSENACSISSSDDGGGHQNQNKEHNSSTSAPDDFQSSRDNSGFSFDEGDELSVPELSASNGETISNDSKQLDVTIVQDGVVISQDKGQGQGQGQDKVQGQGQDRPELKKSINLVHCTAIMVAITGHASIFIAPSSILSVTGSIGASLIVWLLGGLINMGLALCFAELGTMMPEAGGPYAYVMRTFGPLPGFIIMWGYVVLIAGPMWAFLSYTAALYIVKPVFPDCQSTSVNTAVKLLAGWIMMTLVMLNCVYMKYVTKVQTLLASTKIIALTIIVIAGIYQLAIGNLESFESIFEGTSSEPGQWAVAMFYSLFSYGGWQSMTSLIEEVKKPGRDLPLTTYLTFTVVIAMYIMTNVAYFTLIPPHELLNSDAVALLFIRRLYSPLAPVISVLVATTCIGALNASIMGHSRLLFAGARNGHMPIILSMIHPKYLTPWPAIITMLCWGMVNLFSGNIRSMMEFISLYSTIMAIVCISSLLYLRVTAPNRHRPYKTLFLVPEIQLILNIIVLALAIYQKPHQMGIGLAILFAGVPVYWLGVLWRNKPPEFTELVEKLTELAQKILLVAKAY